MHPLPMHSSYCVIKENPSSYQKSNFKKKHKNIHTINQTKIYQSNPEYKHTLLHASADMATCKFALNYSPRCSCLRNLWSAPLPVKIPFKGLFLETWEESYIYHRDRDEHTHGSAIKCSICASDFVWANRRLYHWVHLFACCHKRHSLLR